MSQRSAHLYDENCNCCWTIAKPIKIDLRWNFRVPPVTDFEEHIGTRQHNTIEEYTEREQYTNR